MLGKALIVHLLIGLQIPTEIPAVDIAGADGDPVVAQQYLGVEKARLVFEDAHAGGQQLGVIAAPGVAHGGVVGVRSRQQQAHVCSLARGMAEGAADLP